MLKSELTVSSTLLLVLYIWALLLGRPRVFFEDSNTISVEPLVTWAMGVNDK